MRRSANISHGPLPEPRCKRSIEAFHMISTQIKRLRQSTLARNAAWIFAGQGLSFVIQALYFVFLARLLNPTQYGCLPAQSPWLRCQSVQHDGIGPCSSQICQPGPRTVPEYWGNVLLSTALYGSLIVLILHLTGHLARWRGERLTVDSHSRLRLHLRTAQYLRGSGLSSL